MGDSYHVPGAPSVTKRLLLGEGLDVAGKGRRCGEQACCSNSLISLCPFSFLLTHFSNYISRNHTAPAPAQAVTSSTICAMAIPSQPGFYWHQSPPRQWQETMDRGPPPKVLLLVPC